jgi:hypothetical protein
LKAVSRRAFEGLGTASGALDGPSFELLAALGFALVEIDAANSFCRGAP